MKKTFLLLPLALILSFPVTAAEDLLQRIDEAAPTGISMLETEENNGVFTLTGLAESNSQISMFLQILGRERLGKNIDLQEVRPQEDLSRFVILIWE